MPPKGKPINIDANTADADWIKSLPGGKYDRALWEALLKGETPPPKPPAETEEERSHPPTKR